MPKKKNNNLAPEQEKVLNEYIAKLISGDMSFDESASTICKLLGMGEKQLASLIKKSAKEQVNKDVKAYKEQRMAELTTLIDGLDEIIGSSKKKTDTSEVESNDMASVSEPYFPYEDKDKSGKQKDKSFEM